MKLSDRRREALQGLSSVNSVYGEYEATHNSAIYEHQHPYKGFFIDDIRGAGTRDMLDHVREFHRLQYIDWRLIFAFPGNVGETDLVSLMRCYRRIGGRTKHLSLSLRVGVPGMYAWVSVYSSDPARQAEDYEARYGETPKLREYIALLESAIRRGSPFEMKGDWEAALEAVALEVL